MSVEDVVRGMASHALVQLIELDLGNATVRASTAAVDWRDADGDIYLGAGAVLDIGGTYRSINVRGGGIDLTWNGATPALMGAARDGSIVGTSIRVLWVAVDRRGQQVGEKRLEFDGVVTRKPNIRAADAVISLSAEPEYLRLQRARPFRNTPESQARFFPGDTFFDRVAYIQDASFKP